MVSNRNVANTPQIDAAAGDGQWFVLRTRSRQEKAVVSELAAMGTAHYLPLVRTARYYGRRKVQVDLPLFPGYVFLFGELEQAYDADRSRRVAQLIRVPDQAELQRQLENLELALSRGAQPEACSQFEAGVRVEVRSGPFKGVQGVVQSRGRADRLVLEVGVLGQGASLEIEQTLLEPIDAAAASTG